MKLSRKALLKKNQHGAAFAEAILFLAFASLMIAGGLNVFSTGIVRSYCRASLVLTTDPGGGTDEVSGGDGSGASQPGRRNPGSSIRDVVRESAIESCVRVATKPRMRLGGGPGPGRGVGG